MAPIYLANKTNVTSSGPNVFRARGITGYSPSTLTSLAVVGIPVRRELAYDGYYRNIDAFISATASQRTVFCDRAGYSSDIFKSGRNIEIPTPNVAYMPMKPMAADKERAFADKIGAENFEKIGKATIYYIQTPESKILASLVKTCSDNFACGPDAVTPLGYAAYQFITGCVTEFLAVHSYSAFGDRNRDVEGTMEIRGLTRPKRNYPASFVTTTRKTRWEYVGDAEGLGLIVDETEDEPEDEHEKEKWFKKSDPNHHGFIIGNLEGAVLKAKPSPFLPSHNFGPASQIPASDGLVFPYFNGMNTPDPLIFKIMTSTFFIRLLGSNTNQVQDNYVKLRRGFNSLATTTVGKMLAHMLAGIKLALDSQARVYMIYDDEYRGFALLGSGFTIVDGAKLAVPMEKALFREDLAAFNPHQTGLLEVSKALTELKEFGALKIADDAVTPEDLDTVDSVVSMLGQLEIGESDDEKEMIRKLEVGLKKLSFPGDPFLSIGPDSIATLIARIQAHYWSDSIIRYNLRFSNWDAPYGDRLYRILAMFGTDVPSPWNTSGSEISILRPAKEGSADPEDGDAPSMKKRRLDKEEFGSLPSALIFAPKPLRQAYKDWKMVLAKGVVRMDLKERARAYRCCEVKDLEKRQTIWNGLGALLVEAKKRGPAEVSKKEGKKKEVVPVNYSADDLFDMF